MGRIHVLEAALADQIAAGEVVERPASVVKELVENALDAGATRVTVETRGGGVELVRVTDDGEGMDPGDAVLSLRRHATSKLRTADDLFAIRTLGFRGEALPSIASVSRLVLVTRTEDALAATRVEVLAGGEPAVSEAGAAKGTTVEVHDLFGSVPARRKFLRAAGTESAHVADVCLRVALAHPGLSLRLVRDGRVVREWLPAPALAERARAALDGESLAEVSGVRDGVTVLALLAAPERARGGGAALYAYVNGRPVRDRALSRAVAFAYGSVLPPGRFPVGVVHVGVDPAEVDVNVHPQKAEVRFARGREVLDAVTRVLARGLGTTPWGGRSSKSAGFWDARLPAGPQTTGEEVTRPRLGVLPLPLAEEPSRVEDRGERYTAIVDEILRAPESAAASASAPQPSEAAVPQPSQGDAAPQPSRGDAAPQLRFLAQVRRMLLVCETDTGLAILDQHAADERIRFHRLRTQYLARTPSVQRLLFPERVELSPAEVALLEEARAELVALGLDVSALGPTTVAVHAVPAIVKRAAPEQLVRDVTDELARAGERGFGDAVDMSLATMACHGAIRAGDALAPAECEALLAALAAVPEFAGHCPHGRPIVMELPFSEIERRVGR